MRGRRRLRLDPGAGCRGFLVTISGTPIVSKILIPFLIPKIPVGIVFEIPMSGESENWNSNLRNSEFR
jgi:hypothetical protein